MNVLPWYCTRDLKLCVAWTTVGIVKVVGNTFPPWYLRTRNLLGFSVYLGTSRIKWVPDLTAALQVAENEVKARMQFRRVPA